MKIDTFMKIVEIFSPDLIFEEQLSMESNFKIVRLHRLFKILSSHSQSIPLQPFIKNQLNPFHH